MSQQALIVLTSGKQDRGTRATLAFSWGCTALAMGQTVTLFMTMEGTVWALRGATRNVAVGGFEPLQEYIEQFLALGGELLLCAPCSEYYCSFERDPGDSLIPDVKLAGLATIVSKTNEGCQVITL